MSTMNDAKGSRRWPLMIVLLSGVLGGAGADAVISLRAKAAQAPVATDRTALVQNAESAASQSTLAADSEVESSCSCADGLDTVADTSPIAPRRKAHNKAHRLTPVRLDLCAVSSAEQ